MFHGNSHRLLSFRVPNKKMLIVSRFRYTKMADDHHNPHQGFQIAPFRGIVHDAKARAKYYKADWVNGVAAGLRILVPTAYIFFQTALPVIVFGEQLHRETDGTLSAFETLTGTAICGTIHAIIGGQPLIILGVAEPTVYMYKDLYKIAKTNENLGKELFVAWAGWVCVWASLLLLIFAVLGASSYVTKMFTRVVGELFEALIAVLFIHQAIQGIVREFRQPEDEKHIEVSSAVALEPSWVCVNGLFQLILSLGLVITASKTRGARSWRYGSGWLREFIADYGVPVVVVLWVIVSYSGDNSFPEGVPRRLSSPNAWDPTPNARWTIIKDMRHVPISYIFFAILPGVMLAGLYIFDHSVAAQMAEQELFHLTHPGAHHYDMFLLGFMVLLCGLLGVPPISGMVPQSPMHTKSLAKLNKEMVRKQLVATAKKSIEEKATLKELYGSMQEAYRELHAPFPKNSAHEKELKDLKELRNLHFLMESPIPIDINMFDPEKDVDALLPVTVNEQRLTNLGQALLTGGCIAAMPFIKKVPVSLLWGYFLYMAIDTMQGNQFWERLLLICSAPSRRYKVLEEFHASFMETVPFKTIAAFTVFQLVFLLSSWGITWIPMAGVLFPSTLFVLVLLRQYVLPRIINPQHLWELDASKYEEAPGIPHERALMEAEVTGLGNAAKMRRSASVGEILDNVTARGRGELRFCSARMEHLRGSELDPSSPALSRRATYKQRSTRRWSNPLHVESGRVVPIEESTSAPHRQSSTGMPEIAPLTWQAVPPRNPFGAWTFQAFMSSTSP